MAFKKLFSSKYLVVAMHVVFWTLIIISPYLFRNPTTWKGFNAWHYRGMANNAMLAGLFYLNAYYLYPVLYKKRKQLALYVVSLVAIVAGIIFFLKYLDHLLYPNFERPKIGADMHGKGEGGGMRRFGPGGPGGRGREGFRGGSPMFLWWYFTNMITYIFVIGISISYRIIIDNSKLEKIRKERENENLRSELTFLRSQVSPHFIFNILNNMVSLARKKSDMLEPSLIELSKLMRYMLYENDEERVSLAREVEYLKSYIALQHLRFGDDVTIVFNPPEDINAYYLEPMLLVPFVENAFKHGVGMVEDPHINIVLDVDRTSGWLDFKVMNAIAPQQHTKDKSSGIGLANVRRRLELLYNNDYALDIRQSDNIFIAELKIKLK
ncbi:sensor histidine kinase [Mucilaginibacter myungsuensis]|uniref:Histidine kinase n=1 Tax=Mucilaginibacter myungsuensis TaxID=649104 RepID=A0A929L295_9SPHI|nr:histidine kinase [Mucilaginibacter myungsuensis]MBE9661906.1 histidine kinase [Mucilaginibacter myungsuensis]MDN3599660.1 histidine kinase [Mucilaginibacter myungsuensis]